MIEFNKPKYDNSERNALEDALLNGTDYIERLKSAVGGFLKSDHLFFTVNGSSALEMLFASTGLKKDDEVMMPSFNFPSGANSALRMGAKPVFLDTDPETLVIDKDEIIKKTTKKSACINPIHYGGASVDMDWLIDFSKSKRILVLEDAALAYGAEYKGKKLGTIGDFGIFSFDQTKNLSCEKGGLAIVNNKSEDMIRFITRLYNNGTDKAEFLKGQVPFYSWQQVGMNVAMSNTTAAILYAQLKKSEVINRLRKSIYDVYVTALSPKSDVYGYKLPKIPTYNQNNYHVFYLVFSSHEKREEVRQYLKNKGIAAHVHYTPLHLSKMGQDLGYKKGDLPHTEKIADTMLRLPLHNCMTTNQAEIVASAVLEAVCR